MIERSVSGARARSPMQWRGGGKKRGSRVQQDELKPGSRETWIPVPSLLLVSSVTLGKSYSFSSSVTWRV